VRHLQITFTKQRWSVQLFASVGTGWPHNALWCHQLSCHFWDSKAPHCWAQVWLV